MSELDLRSATRPWLITVDGEAKTAKTTAGDAISSALRELGMNVYEADAGAFFRRLTVGSLELLGYSNLTLIDDVPQISADDLHKVLPTVIADDLAYDKRDDWDGLLKCKIVEKYVSVVGKTDESQHAMDDWYGRMLQEATEGSFDVLVINARNPRDRLRKWATPMLDLLVYCEPREAARRILSARGNKHPSDDDLDMQMTDVIARRTSDRERGSYPYQDPETSINYVDTTTGSVDSIIGASWSLDSIDMKASEPTTVRLDTTEINLKQTRDIVAALALAALEYVPALETVGK